MNTKIYYVYIMTSISGTLYVGMTNSAYFRTIEHKEGREINSFTRRYKVNRLVYFETFKYVHSAIAREKEIKGWRRSKKIALIESQNPGWRDLWKDFGQQYKPDRDAIRKRESSERK